MEQNLQILPKKVWSVLRLFYFMLRKGISKNKLWLDLNLMLKRAKLAGKALQNLLFHHHHTWAAFTVNRPSPHLSFHSPPPGEHEFSCTTSPSTNNNQFSIFSLKKMKNHNGNKTMQDIDMKGFDLAVLKAMEMIQSETGSPGLPGFGRSPVVRQLRVTDSPFPVTGVDEDEDEDYSRVDEEAERFINRFYSDLRRQKQIRGSETAESSPLITMSTQAK